MTRRPSTSSGEPDAPITGVAAGSLGTAANLDDTQVMRTEDLKAAAPDGLEDAGAAVAREPAADPPEERAPLQAPPQATPAEPVAPVKMPVSRAAAVAQPRETAARPRPAAVDSSTRSRRSMPALAGVAALVLLLLIAGSGFLSQLDLGSGTGPAPASSANALIEAAPSPTPAPKEGKGGSGKCHGRGHNCQGNGD
jgi:hypothetical protein